MADVRALLKAKRQEARITHPYATYTPSNQLKCLVCGTLVKHASAWEGHLGSKAHRTNIVRLREEEKKEQDLQESQQREPERTGKRKSSVDPSDVHVEKKRKVESQPQGSQSFPGDFFSDPLRAPLLLSEDEEDNPTETTPQGPPGAASVVDLEYERFQRELLNAVDPSETYALATVAAEPVVASTEVAGFPSSTTVDEEALEPKQLTEEEVRLKRQQEDRELIMDRLLEEERAQEDADNRVELLKRKLEGLRKKREAAKGNKMDR